MEISISKEDYLKAIAEAETEGNPVIAATLVRWLKVTPAAVAMALRRLKRDGFVDVRKDGSLVLTAEGRQVAERLRVRHHLIERMLVEMFGMEWFKVHEEAERLEHAVSDDFLARLIEKVGIDGRCPHGNDIRSDTAEHRRKQGWIALSELPAGKAAGIMSVFERDRQLLEYFDKLGVRPGASVTVLQHNSDDTLTLELDGRNVPLGRSGADRVWVALSNSTSPGTGRLGRR